MIFIPVLIGLYLIAMVGYVKMVSRILENTVDPAILQVDSRIIKTVLLFFAAVWPVSLFLALVKEAIFDGKS